MMSLCRVRQLIRLLKDLRCREESFQSLNPWHLELLVCYVVV